MTQQIIYAFELLVVAGFVWAEIYAWVRQSAPLEKCQRTGCLYGGGIIPLLFLILAISTGEPGGPLFWPLIAILGAMLGIIGGTIYSVCRCRK